MPSSSCHGLRLWLRWEIGLQIVPDAIRLCLLKLTVPKTQQVLWHVLEPRKTVLKALDHLLIDFYVLQLQILALFQLSLNRSDLSPDRLVTNQ